jgi:hypothetical protein
MELVKEFGQFGAMGLVAAVLFWQISRLQDKLIQIIERNTTAFQELKSIIEKCQFSHNRD